MENSELKLIYINKVGYTSKGEGLYEFIFSKDETNVDIENWLWDKSPACYNASAPTDEYVDLIVELKTKTFDLFCLHEAVDREYMHGYHTIHALAYEIEKTDENGYVQYENMEKENESPLLVFHYGITLETVENIFKSKNITYKDNKFIENNIVIF
jgi:hypothetical protein